MASPFDFSQTLPVGGSILVPCSLPGPPVVQHLTQMVTMAPGQGGRLQPVRFPNKTVWGGTSLVVHTCNAGGVDSIPGWGIKLPYASLCGQKQDKTKNHFLGKKNPDSSKKQKQNLNLPHALTTIYIAFVLY